MIFPVSLEDDCRQCYSIGRCLGAIASYQATDVNVTPEALLPWIRSPDRQCVSGKSWLRMIRLSP